MDEECSPRRCHSLPVSAWMKKGKSPITTATTTPYANSKSYLKARREAHTTLTSKRNAILDSLETFEDVDFQLPDLSDHSFNSFLTTSPKARSTTAASSSITNTPRRRTRPPKGKKQLSKSLSIDPYGVGNASMKAWSHDDRSCDDKSFVFDGTSTCATDLMLSSVFDNTVSFHNGSFSSLLCDFNTHEAPIRDGTIIEWEESAVEGRKTKASAEVTTASGLVALDDDFYYEEEVDYDEISVVEASTSETKRVHVISDGEESTHDQYYEEEVLEETLDRESRMEDHVEEEVQEGSYSEETVEDDDSADDNAMNGMMLDKEDIKEDTSFTEETVDTDDEDDAAGMGKKSTRYDHDVMEEEIGIVDDGQESTEGYEEIIEDISYVEEIIDDDDDDESDEESKLYHEYAEEETSYVEEVLDDDDDDGKDTSQRNSLWIEEEYILDMETIKARIMGINRSVEDLLPSPDDGKGYEYVVEDDDGNSDFDYLTVGEEVEVEEDEFFVNDDAPVKDQLWEEEPILKFDVPVIPAIVSWQAMEEHRTLILDEKPPEVASRTPREILMAVLNASSMDFKLRKVPQEHKKRFVSIADTVASLGRLSRLKEVVVEGVGHASQPEDEYEDWMPTGAPIVFPRSVSLRIATEAASMGRVVRLTEEAVTNYEDRRKSAISFEEVENRVDIDDMLDENGHSIIRTSVLLPLHEQSVKETSKAKDWSAALLEATTTMDVSLDTVELPCARIPRFKKPSLPKSMTRQDIQDAIAQGVAEKAWDRRYRLDRPHKQLRITSMCRCPYCPNPNPFQTHAYKNLANSSLEYTSCLPVR